MFETKRGDSYKPYNTTINKNIYEWKKYPKIESYFNRHFLPEFRINISDAVLKGTENSLYLEDIVYNTF